LVSAYEQGQGVDLQREDREHSRAWVVGPYLAERARRDGARSGGGARSQEARLAEAEGLAMAIELEVAGSQIVQLSEIRPATFIGPGKAEEIAAEVKAHGVDLVVMDCALSPVQQRNLEKAFAAKVIDRTGLILEIFGKRARTREGRLQVELAHLSYQRSRLVRSWTHLERQRGGFGFLGGPGETQIEADRRLIQERITRIERDLEQVKRTRGLHRKQRSRVPYPVIALVGYTNAGKSTLFNQLTSAGIDARDMLFATLDPTMRLIQLPHGEKAMLSDTVGFISDLPTMLVSAFQATLEEVLEAQVILHVRDIADPDTQAQSEDVEKVLRQLGVEPDQPERIVEVWNKIDLLPEEEAQSLRRIASRRPPESRPCIVSALTGQGTSDLLLDIETRVTRGRAVFELALPAADGAGLAWIYDNAEVLERSAPNDEEILLQVRIAPERAEAFLRQHPHARPIRDDRNAPQTD